MARISRKAVIDHIEHDSDGWWIILNPGFQNGLDMGTHAIHEDRKADAMAALTSVKPCDCEECRRLKQGASVQRSRWESC